MFEGDFADKICVDIFFAYVDGGRAEGLDPKARTPISVRGILTQHDAAKSSSVCGILLHA
jgi:hypothetical protein